jgi:hypothetical protein
MWLRAPTCTGGAEAKHELTEMLAKLSSASGALKHLQQQRDRTALLMCVAVVLARVGCTAALHLHPFHFSLGPCDAERTRRRR